MMTEEQIVARLLAGRLDKPPQPAPPPKPAVKAKERWAEKPTEVAILDAAAHNRDVAERLRREREFADAEVRRARYQAVLDAHWQSMLDARAEIEAYRYIGGFREPVRASCHRGPRDSAWGLL
jgi:hypothetical protein